MTVMNPVPKVITGSLHSDNRMAIDWGYQNLLAYGCHCYAVIVDMNTQQIVQTVGPQKANITHVRWRRENFHHAYATGSTYMLCLACADSSGNVMVWDVASGQVQTVLSDTGRNVMGLEWYSGQDNCQDILMVLRIPDILEMWDSYTGARLWKIHIGNSILSLALDPFDSQRMIFLCDCPRLLIMSDISLSKKPSNNFKYFQFSDPNPASPATSPKLKLSVSQEKSLPLSTNSFLKMASLATSMIRSSSDLAKRRQSTIEDETEILNSCLQLAFSRVHQDILLLLFASEIQIIDIDAELVVSTVWLDGPAAAFVKIVPCQTVDMLLCLHENGSISLRTRRQTTSQKSGVPSANSVAMEMIYDLKFQSEPVRLLRHSKVFNMVCQPVTELQVGLVLNDSRVVLMDILTRQFGKISEDLHSERHKLTLADFTRGMAIMPYGYHSKYSQEKITIRAVISGLISGIISPITLVSVMPTDDERNPDDTILALGSDIGIIQLVNVHSGQIDKEYKLFMSPVRGLDWIDRNRLIAFAYADPPLYGNRVIQSVIVLLTLCSGEVVTISGEKDSPGAIKRLRVSPSRKVFTVMYKTIVELWSITPLQKVCCITLPDVHRVTDMHWLPCQQKAIKKGKVTENDKIIVKEHTVAIQQLFICGQFTEHFIYSVMLVDETSISQKEIAFPDIKFDFESSKTELTCIAFKKELMLLASTSGQVFAWLVSSKQEYFIKLFEKTGYIARSIKFAPGLNNRKFMILYSNCVDIYELITTCDEVEYLTSSPTSPSDFVDADWVGPDSIVIATKNGFLHVMDITSKLQSPTKTMDDEFLYVNCTEMSTSSSIIQRNLPGFFNIATMDPKLAFYMKYCLQAAVDAASVPVSNYISCLDQNVLAYMVDKCIVDRCYAVARLFGDEFDMNFWGLLRYSFLSGRLDKRPMQDLNKPFIFSDWFPKTPAADTYDPITLGNECINGDGTQRQDCTTTNPPHGERHQEVVSSLAECMNFSDYKMYEASRLELCNKKRTDYRMAKICVNKYIMSGKVDMAVQLLMETDTEHMNFKSDCYKACLTSCDQMSSVSMCTTKLVATHLIAAGHLNDGVDLLCLMNKRQDACNYLISHGCWKEAVWMAKTSMNEAECLGIIYKWAEHLWNHNKKIKALLLMIAHGEYSTALHMLCDLRQFDTAALFLAACTQQGVLEKSSTSDRVYAEFAKVLTGIGYTTAADHYLRLVRSQDQHCMVVV